MSPREDATPYKTHPTNCKLSKAERERRRVRRMQRQFADANFAQVGCDPEPPTPPTIPRNLREYCLSEIRYRVRQNRKCYGAHLAERAEKAFGPLRLTDRKALESWINWLVRNRIELMTGGRYAVSSSLGSVPQTSDPVDRRQEGALVQREAAQSSAVHFERRVDASAPDLFESSSDKLNGPTRGKAVPQMPERFQFQYKRAGAEKANAFFGAIYFSEPLEKVLACASALVADKDAVEEVLNRGRSENEYLIQAMSDLGIPLP